LFRLVRVVECLKGQEVQGFTEFRVGAIFPETCACPCRSNGRDEEMRTFLRSLITALCIAGAVQLFTVGVLAPRLPPVMGQPAVQEDRTLVLPSAALFRLDNQDGSVHVHTHKRDDIRVQAEARAYTREDDAYPIAERYVASLIAVDATPEVLAIVTEPEERPDAVEIQVDYTILVPERTDITIEGANGNVWVSKGCGCVTVHGRNTDIEIVEPQGSVRAQSTNGRIRVVDAVDDTTLETVNGNVYAHMNAGALRAVTTNGAIVAHMRQPLCGDFNLSSQNGGITLVMSEGGSGRVEASTGRGVIKSDLPVDVSSGVRKRRHLQGAIGPGNTKLIMNTLNGNIWITRSRT